MGEGTTVVSSKSKTEVKISVPFSSNGRGARPAGTSAQTGGEGNFSIALTLAHVPFLPPSALSHGSCHRTWV